MSALIIAAILTAAAVSAAPTTLALMPSTSVPLVPDGKLTRNITISTSGLKFFSTFTTSSTAKSMSNMTRSWTMNPSSTTTISILDPTAHPDPISVATLESATPQVTGPSVTLHPGQVLNVPSGGNVGNPSTSQAATYTAVSGDSIWLISQKLGVSVAALESANSQVTGPSFTIHPGQVLIVPSGGSAPDPSTPPATTSYTAVSGDSLWLISQKLGVSIGALESANPQVPGPSFILHPGQVLVVPSGGSAPNLSTPPATTSYTAVSGDSLWLISQKLGVSIDALESANPQVPGPSFILHPGQVLNVPSGSGVPSGGSTVDPNNGATPPGQTLKSFSGPASNFPDPSTWVDFDSMASRQAATMDTTGNSHQETQYVLNAVAIVSAETGIDKRGILAVIMQESHGQVRVQSTSSPGAGVHNTGIMQAHNGVSFDPNNPEASITQMVRDGAAGVAGPTGGDGLKQLIQRYGNFFIACRGYNSGDGGINMQDLSDGGGATSSYVSDIANRLLGVDPN